MLASRTVQGFLTELASSSPAPGGGSASALAGALGCALTAMVCQLTLGKKKYEAVQGEMQELFTSATNIQQELVALMEKDTEAFNTVMQSFSMPKDTDEQKERRSKAIQSATTEATQVPLRVMELCDDALSLTSVVAEKGNVNSISDAGVGALLLQAGCQGAALNVLINLATLKDELFVTATRQSVERIQASVGRKHAQITTKVQSALS
jgi:methenyltetrahydrofolate cyclohydrolase